MNLPPVQHLAQREQTAPLRLYSSSLFVQVRQPGQSASGNKSKDNTLRRSTLRPLQSCNRFLQSSFSTPQKEHFCIFGKVLINGNLRWTSYCDKSMTIFCAIETASLENSDLWSENLNFEPFQENFEVSLQRLLVAVR
jgi:hypothetical protein